jgi:hypothetical protein
VPHTSHPRNEGHRRHDGFGQRLRVLRQKHAQLVRHGAAIRVAARDARGSLFLAQPPRWRRDAAASAKAAAAAAIRGVAAQLRARWRGGACVGGGEHSRCGGQRRRCRAHGAPAVLAATSHRRSQLTIAMLFAACAATRGALRTLNRHTRSNACSGLRPCTTTRAAAAPPLPCLRSLARIQPSPHTPASSSAGGGTSASAHSA